MPNMPISRSSSRALQKNLRRSRRSTWRGYLPMLLLGLLVGLMLSAGMWLWRNLNDPHTLPFHTIRVVGQFQHLQADQLRQTVQSQIHGGFFTVSLAAIRQSLLSNPWVEDVALRRVPGTLYVMVREHRPIARWNDRYLIDTEEQLFPIPPDAPDRLPLLQSPDDQEALVLANYKQINRLLKPLQLQIQQITVDDRQSWELVLSNGVIVTIGREEVLARVQRLVHWYPQIVSDKVNPIAHIDLRYSNSIAVEFHI